MPLLKSRVFTLVMHIACTGLIAETPIMWSHVTINGHFSLAFSCLRGNLCELHIATGHRT
jgi:hypothetical protein